MKLALRIFGVLLMLLGAVWILQGINVLPGSFMTGKIEWAILGSGSVAVGFLLIALTRRPRNKHGA